MASGRLLDNRIIDRLSVNKSNKSDKKTNTEFDDNMADFLGTWKAPSKTGQSETITVIEKKPDNTYTMDTKVMITIDEPPLILLKKNYIINTAYLNTINITTAYNNIQYLFEPVPEYGVNEPTYPYYGGCTNYTLNADKTTMIQKGDLNIDKKILLENIEKYPAITPLIDLNSIIGSTMILGTTIFKKQ